MLRFIIEDGRSFETTSGSGLINLWSVLTQEQYHPPHPTTLSQNLGDMVDDLYINFQQSIKSQFISKPSITFDHFKANNGDNFFVSTCHFISSSWVLESCCLSVVNLEVINACHKATSTEEILRNVLSKFDLTCTLKLLGIDWLGCCAHKLQLCIKSAIHNQQILVTLISKGHKIVGFFHSSSVGQAALKKYQISQGKPESKPPMDVETHFNSTSNLLEWV